MNDGMYTNIRNYLEEHSSLLRQILEELKAQKSAPTPTPTPANVPADAVGPVTVETVETVDSSKATAKKGK